MERVILLSSSSSWLYCCDCQCTVQCDFIMCGWVLRTIQRTILQTIGAIIRLVRHVFPSHNNNSTLTVWWVGRTGCWLDWLDWTQDDSQHQENSISSFSKRPPCDNMWIVNIRMSSEWNIVPLRRRIVDCCNCCALCILSAFICWMVVLVGILMEWVNGWTMEHFPYAFECNLGLKMVFCQNNFVALSYSTHFFHPLFAVLGSR